MSGLTVVGNYISPYVRKVLICLDLKGLDYRIDPITPFVGDDRFSACSPLRRVPVLFDGDLVLNDSSVICQYLEDKHPAPALYPANIVDRARARWIEEYCRPPRFIRPISSTAPGHGGSKNIAIRTWRMC
jgi:glutathione S-transferase